MPEFPKFWIGSTLPQKEKFALSPNKKKILIFKLPKLKKICVIQALAAIIHLKKSISNNLTRII